MSSLERASLDFRPVDAETWPDLVRLFEGPGGPKHCWCLVWRLRGAQAHMAVPERKAELERRMHEAPVGILAYADGEPVGWCSVAPRPTYRPMGGGEPQDDAGAWTIACFYVPRRARGAGVATRLLDAGVAFAAENGARVVEAYPVAIDSPSFRFMGFVEMFRAAGFEYVKPVGTRRHLMQRRLGGGDRR